MQDVGVRIAGWSDGGWVGVRVGNRVGGGMYIFQAGKQALSERMVMWSSRRIWLLDVRQSGT